MQIHADKAGLLLLIASGQQTGDDTCEHIAASSRRHSCIACRIEDHMSVGQTERRMMPFQDDESLQALGKGAGLGELFVAVGAVTFQPLQFLGVGGQDDTLRHLLQPGAMVSHDVDGIGIDDDRTLTASDLCNDGNSRLLGGA